MSNWKESFRQSSKLSQDSTFLQSNFKTLITPLIAEKIKKYGVDSPIGKQFIPAYDETDALKQSTGLLDPIADEKYLAAPGLIHRYPNRALYIPTSTCPVHCRYCFRRNEIENQTEIFERDIEAAVEYLKMNPEIDEIIFTGGDPLSLDTPRLEKIIVEFKKISSLHYLRFHTRFISTIPERIDEAFLNFLKNTTPHFKSINVVLHINSHLEICHEVEQAILKLRETKVTLLSQSVLLKDVNNNADQLVRLFKKLSDLGVRPYYLHHADKVFGATHFMTSLEEGRKIYHEVRKQLSGWMIPEYVIDLPSGGGKVPAYNSEHFEFSGKFINRFQKTEQYH